MTYLEKSLTRENLNAAFHDTISHSPATPHQETADRMQRYQPPQSLPGGPGRQRYPEEMLPVASGGEALSPCSRTNILDGIVVDIRSKPDIPAVQLVEQIQTETGRQTPPVVLCGIQNLGADLESDLKRLGRSSVIRFAPNNEALLEETVLLLHRAESEMDERQRGDPRRTSQEMM